MFFPFFPKRLVFTLGGHFRAAMAVVIAAAVVIGDGHVHSAQLEPETSYVVIIVCYLSRVRNSRLARIVNMADSSGSRNPPRCTDSLFRSQGQALVCKRR